MKKFKLLPVLSLTLIFSMFIQTSAYALEKMQKPEDIWLSQVEISDENNMYYYVDEKECNSAEEVIKSIEGKLPKGSILYATNIFEMLFVSLNSKATIPIEDIKYIVHPFIITLYEDFISDVDISKKKLTYLKSDFKKGSGRLQKAKFNTKYTVLDLIKRSALEKDVIAYNILYREYYEKIKKSSEYKRSFVAKTFKMEKKAYTPRDINTMQSYIFWTREHNLSIFSTLFREKSSKALIQDNSFFYQSGNKIIVTTGGTMLYIEIAGNLKKAEKEKLIKEIAIGLYFY